MNRTISFLKMAISMILSTIIMAGCTKGEQDLTGRFSVSDSKSVLFAHGNLAEDGRSFTDHQYDYGGLFEWGGYDAQAVEGGDWRTLSQEEWHYLLTGRKNAERLYGMGTIDTIHGMIILPDIWTLPDNCTFIAGAGSWSRNQYTPDKWNTLEAAGAIFLPAAGSIDSRGILNGRGSEGHYWSSTNYSGSTYYSILFISDFLNTRYTIINGVYISVRLVRD